MTTPNFPQVTYSVFIGCIGTGLKCILLLYTTHFLLLLNHNVELLVSIHIGSQPLLIKWNQLSLCAQKIDNNPITAK